MNQVVNVYVIRGHIIRIIIVKIVTNLVRVARIPMRVVVYLAIRIPHYHRVFNAFAQINIILIIIKKLVPHVINLAQNVSALHLIVYVMGILILFRFQMFKASLLIVVKI